MSKPDKPEPEQPARAIKDGPWCWQNKAALRLINESFSESNRISSALCVYVALTKLASDHHQSKRFQVAKSRIAEAAGVSIRTVTDVLAVLESIKVVKIERQKISGSAADAPSFYTILPVGNGCMGVGNGCTPVGNHRFRPALPDLKKESKKNLRRIGEKRGSASRPARPTLEDVKMEAAKIGLPESEAEGFFDHFESNGWKVGGKAPMKSWQAALKNWKRRVPEFASKQRRPASTQADHSKGF